MNDIIIIGQGPAGISAAVYIARAGFKVTVIANGYGSLEKTDKIENYYGFTNPISGMELIENGINQAKRLGVNIINEEVTSISKEENFIVKTNVNKYESKTVLLATGKPRQSVKIKGFEQFRGNGISFCAVCDGFFYRNKRLAVIGNGDYAASELEELLMFTKDITLFTNGLQLQTNKIPENIKIVNDKITEITGTDYAEGIVTENGKYDVDGIFVALGTASATDFAAKIGVMLEGNDIKVDESYMTNVDGLFAAGDCIGGFLQVSKAVSDGAVASKGIIKYLKSNK